MDEMQHDLSGYAVLTGGDVHRWVYDPTSRPNILDITTLLSTVAEPDGVKLRDIGKLAAGADTSPYAKLEAAHDK